MPVAAMAALESTFRLAHVQIKTLLKPWFPTTTAVRWRTRKPNIQRPIPDHYLKARYKAAVQPIYPNMLEGKPWYEVCGNVINPQKKEEGEYKYEQLLAEEFYHLLSTSKLIAVFQENPTKALEKIRIRRMLHPHKARMVFGSTKIARMALTGTELEPVLQLHVGSTAYMCCKDNNVPKFLKFTRKMPTYVLLGAVLEGRLLTKSQLLWVSSLPSIDMLRAELCSILSSSTSQLSQNLTHHQQTLSRSLELHAGEAGDKEKDS